MIALVARRLAKAFKHFPGRRTDTNLHCLGCDSSKVISAMDQSPIHKICVLKMNIKCENCQKRVKKMLQKIHGVHSININANEGKVVVSSTVDPQLFIAMFAREGRKAELLSESAAKPQAMMNNHNEAEHQGKKMQNSTPKAKDIAANLMDRDINTTSQLAQLEEFAKIPGLKQVEVNQSRNIRLMFRDSDDLGCSSGEGNDIHHHRIVNINVDDHMQGPGGPEVQEQHGDAADEPAKSTPPKPPQPPEPPSPTLPLKSPYGSGRDCDGGSSVHCCHDRPEVKFACSGGAPLGIRYMEEPIKHVSYYAPPPPYYLHPFAPPPSYYAQWGPPPPHPSVAHPPPHDMYFSEHNRDCSMM